jgi:hypothetical protein
VTAPPEEFLNAIKTALADADGKIVKIGKPNKARCIQTP